MYVHTDWELLTSSFPKCTDHQGSCLTCTVVCQRGQPPLSAAWTQNGLAPHYRRWQWPGCTAALVLHVSVVASHTAPSAGPDAAGQPCLWEVREGRAGGGEGGERQREKIGERRGGR